MPVQRFIILVVSQVTQKIICEQSPSHFCKLAEGLRAQLLRLVMPIAEPEDMTQGLRASFTCSCFWAFFFMHFFGCLFFLFRQLLSCVFSVLWRSFGKMPDKIATPTACWVLRKKNPPNAAKVKTRHKQESIICSAFLFHYSANTEYNATKCGTFLWTLCEIHPRNLRETHFPLRPWIRYSIQGSLSFQRPQDTTFSSYNGRSWDIVTWNHIHDTMSLSLPTVSIFSGRLRSN